MIDTNAVGYQNVAARITRRKAALANQLPALLERKTTKVFYQTLSQDPESSQILNIRGTSFRQIDHDSGWLSSQARKALQNMADLDVSILFIVRPRSNAGASFPEIIQKKTPIRLL